MGSRRRNLFILLFVIGLAVASVAVVLSKPTKLGLDLRGGTQLVYQARPTPQNPEIEPDDMDRALEIIRERTDELGVAEPEIARVGTDQLEVGLPDVQNAQRAIDQVGNTAQMYFYDWEPNVIGEEPDDPNAAERTFPNLYEAVTFAAKQRPECFQDRCTTNGPTYYLFDRDTHEVLAGPELARKDLFIEFKDRQPPNSTVIAVPRGTRVVEAEDPSGVDPEEAEELPSRYFVIRDRPELSGDDITNPEQNFDPQTNQPIVTFDFTDQGRESFEEVTRRIAQRGQAELLPGQDASAVADHFAIVLDDKVVSRPIIDPIENPNGIDGRNGAQISGSFTIQEAQDLAEFLRIGALPVELTLISQSTVSATLGQEALDQGLRAGIAGLIVVLLFLIAYYRLLGVVAGLGLLVYAAFFYALIELIPITLTLPGIAGLILTIGVAADSNIVIFERIKEEARAGRSMPSAIAQGYRKGIATIIDANVITLITAFILFVLATAGVKGFAFTLGVGTIVSLFTAVVFTQAVLGAAGRSRALRSPRLLGAGEQRVRWHFDFAGASKWFFSMSGVILAIGAVAFTTKQLNLGIDFESGTRVKASLTERVGIEQVRSALGDAGIEGADGAEIQEVDQPEFGENVVQIQGKFPPAQIGQVQEALDSEFSLQGGDRGFDSTSVGPTFGEQVARNAIRAIVLSLLVISLYVAFRFEPKYAIPVLIAIVHDILITGGVYSLSGREVTAGTVAAFLTILGYSIYDTVIVFDRIRENVPRMPRAAFSQIVNRSMSEVLTRSLITGLSTVFLITVLLVFGGETLKDFAFAMMVGVASGTYSSIFIASPVLTAWKERELTYRSRRLQIERAMGYLPAFPEENVVEKLDEVERAGVPPVPAEPVAEPAVQASADGEPEEGPPAPPVGVGEGQPGAGGDGPPSTGAEPLVGAGAESGQPRRPKDARRARRRQQRRRRKHGRSR